MSASYIGICAWFTPGNHLEDKIKFVKSVGLDGIELDFNHCDGHYALADSALQSQLAVWRTEYAIDFPALAINSLCEFGMSNPEHRDEVERALALGIECAINLDIPIVQLPSFFAGDIADDKGLQHTITAIQHACDLAGGHNIVIGSENAMTAERQLELINRVDRENFRIYFDCRNSWWMKGLPSPEILRAVMPHVCEVHLKDGMGQSDPFCLLGQGDTQVQEILAILKDANYRRKILLENDYNQFHRDGLDPKDCVRRDVDFIHRYF